jgi:hypothetical protein
VMQFKQMSMRRLSGRVTFALVLLQSPWATAIKSVALHVVGTRCRFCNGLCTTLVRSDTALINAPRCTETRLLR